jgi:nucleotide-binding universal stress UspA family protein
MKTLVALDSSDASSKALQQALHLLTHTDMTFVLLSVEELVSIPKISSVPGVLGEDDVMEWQQEADLINIEKEQLAIALTKAEHACQQAGVAFTTRSEIGIPKQTICEIAQKEGCNLIVIGSHSYGWIEKMLSGSTSDYVVHHAHCAVLVVRE